MYLILIGTGFLASVAFSLFLRRMTNSGHYLSRLKKTIHLHEHTLIEVANQQSQKIKDSFLDYEMLLQQGQQTQSLLQKELEEYSGRLVQLGSDKALVKELSLHLNEMAASANTVSQRVESLDLGMQKLSHAEQEIQKIHGQLDLLHTGIEEKGKQAEQKLEEAVEDTVKAVIQQAQVQIQEAAESAQSSYSLLKEDQRNFRNVLESYNEQVADIKSHMADLPRELEKNLEDELERLNSKSQENSDVLRESFVRLEGQLDTVRTQAVETLQADLKIMQKEMEDLNLQTMSRRDEILNETKRMARKVQEQSQAFQEHYLASENRLLQEAESYQERVDEHVSALLKEWEKEQQRRQEQSLQEWEDLKEKIAQVEKQKLFSLETQGGELKENMECLSQELKVQIRAESEEGVALLERSKKEAEQNYQEQKEFAEGIQKRINGRLEERAQKFFADLEENAKALQTGAFVALKEKYDNMQKDLQEQFASQERLQNIISHKLEKQENLFEEFQEEFDLRLKEQNQKSFTDIEEKARTLELDLLTNLQAKSSEMEERAQNFLSEQKNICTEIKEAAQHIEEDLRERLDMESLLTNFEKEAQKCLSEMQKEFSASSEELVRDQVKLREELDIFKLKSLEEMQGEAALLKEESVSLGNLSMELEKQQIELKDGVKGFSKELLEKERVLFVTVEEAKESLLDQQAEISVNLKKSSEKILEQQNKAQQDLKNYSRDEKENLVEEVKKQMLSMERNASAYIEKQESAYGELRQAANKVEKDLRVRLDVDSFLEEAEKEASKRFAAMKEKTFTYFDELEERKKELQNDIRVCGTKLGEFEQGLQAINQVDIYMQQLDESLHVLDQRLEAVHKESAGLAEFGQDIESLRASRRELDSELHILESQRKRLGETEKHLTAINEKMSLLGDAKQLALSIEKRVVHFNEFKENFDHYFGEFQERKQYIEEALEHIEKSRQKASLSNEQSQELLEKVQRTEARQGHLHDRLEQFELRASRLEAMQKQIKEVEIRFEQMDGLMIDLEQKQKQIGGMSQRFDDIKEKGEETIEELSSMFSEADEKIDKLTGFYHVVDTMIDSRLRQEEEDSAVSPSLPGSSKKSRKQKQGNLPDHKHDGILSLYLNHKWQPDLIAERMKIELSTVKAVIASHLNSSVKS